MDSDSSSSDRTAAGDGEEEVAAGDGEEEVAAGDGEEEVAAGDDGEQVQSDRPTASERSDAPFDGRRDYLLLSFVAFCFICFGVWVFSAGKRYREEYAQATEGWRVGTTRSIEVTLVKTDKYNLACASNKDFWGLHCGGDRDLKRTGIDPLMLQPYNTTKNQLFLGAGLWTSPALEESLPSGRFTVVCNYSIKGVVKSARIRFSPTAHFTPLRQTVTAGTLTDCVIPR